MIKEEIYRECELKLLGSSIDNAKIAVSKFGEMETNVHDSNHYIIDWGYFNLYVTSNDKIKECDACIFIGYKSLARAAHNVLSTEIAICKSINKSDDKFYFIHQNNENRSVYSSQVKGLYFKIIASTNTLLGLESPSDEFIQAYIKAYNKGDKIERVLVEYEKYDIVNPTMGKYGTLKNGGSFKRRPTLKDNNIVIKKLNNTWTREELLDKLTVQSLRETFHSQSGMFINKKTSYEIIEWIKETLT